MTPESGIAPAPHGGHSQTSNHHGIQSEADYTAGEDPYEGLPHTADLEVDTTQEDRPKRIPFSDRLLSLSGLAALPVVEPLVDGVLYRDTLAQLAGKPGTYKSFCAVGLAVCVAAGVNWEGHHVPKAEHVVYVAAEGASGLLARILAYCELSGIDPMVVEQRLHVLPCPIQLGDVVDVGDAVDLVTELSAGLLILDTRARCTIGLEENSATEQGTAIHNAEIIQSAVGCTVLGAHHSSRAGTAGRGSNAWDGAIWTDLRIECEKESLTAKIHVEKQKDAPDGHDLHFRLVAHTVSTELMPGLTEQQRRTLVFVEDESMSANQPRTNLTAAHRNADKLADILRTNLTSDGLSSAAIRGIAEEHGIARTAFYEALKLLVEGGKLRNIGTEKRTHYVPTWPTLHLRDTA